jgi:hypothetical protein
MEDCTHDEALVRPHGSVRQAHGLLPSEDTSSRMGRRGGVPISGLAATMLALRGNNSTPESRRESNAEIARFFKFADCYFSAG